MKDPLLVEAENGAPPFGGRIQTGFALGSLLVSGVHVTFLNDFFTPTICHACSVSIFIESFRYCAVHDVAVVVSSVCGGRLATTHGNDSHSISHGITMLNLQVKYRSRRGKNFLEQML